MMTNGDKQEVKRVKKKNKIDLEQDVVDKLRLEETGCVFKSKVASLAGRRGELGRLDQAGPHSSQ